MNDIGYWETDLDERRLSANVGAEQLDRYQRAFCESRADNIRVLAPAGSGKTQTLLWRCLNVVQRGEGYPRFLIVTFTVAARAELQKRLQDPVFNALQRDRVTTVSTLNSFGWKIVREGSKRTDGPLTLVTRKADKAGCVARFVRSSDRHGGVASVLKRRRSLAAGLLDHVDSLKNLGFRLDRGWGKEEFLEHCVALGDLALDPLLDRLISDLQKLDILPDPVRGAIDRRLEVAPTGRGKAGSDPRVELFEGFWPFAVDLFKSMYQTNHLTIDDQKYLALLSVEQARELGRPPPPETRFTHVLVDEFQDISPLDLNLVRNIADSHGASLVIVGDDDQAIYEWRGGSPTFLLEPEQEFERDFDTFLLERNYRCPRNLVEAADALIRRNTRRHPKRIEAVKRERADIVLLDSLTTSEAVEEVMKQVRGFLEDPGPRDRMALVSRKQAQLVPYQILFADEGIEFEAADDLRIFLSRAFRFLIEMVEIRARRDQPPPAQQIVADMVSLCRQVTAGSRDRPLIDRIRRGLQKRLPASYPEAYKTLKELQRAFRVGDIEGFSGANYAGCVWALFASKTVAGTVAAIAGRFEGLSQDFGRGATDIFYRDPPFFYLRAVAERFGDDFRGFLRTLDRASASAEKQEGERRAADAGEDRVYRKIELATALRAKGKEFHTVAILDANAGVWPSVLAETDVQLEAERRLFYVALTRAQEKLIVSWSRVNTEGKKIAPSPYVREARLEVIAEQRASDR